jgi:hypothetical protein
MEDVQRCPECKALWQDGKTCQDQFHQMLFWENEFPEYGVVHHLTVLCYHLQHPSLYSPEGLEYSKQLMVDFLERGLSPEEVRRRSRGQVDSGKRAWKVTGSFAGRGAYAHPVQWNMTAGDVTAGGAEQYVEKVRQWAAGILVDLRVSKNI